MGRVKAYMGLWWYLTPDHGWRHFLMKYISIQEVVYAPNFIGTTVGRGGGGWGVVLSGNNNLLHTNPNFKII